MTWCLFAVSPANAASVLAGDAATVTAVAVVVDDDDADRG